MAQLGESEATMGWGARVGFWKGGCMKDFLGKTVQRPVGSACTGSPESSFKDYKSLPLFGRNKRSWYNCLRWVE